MKVFCLAELARTSEITNLITIVAWQKESRNTLVQIRKNTAREEFVEVHTFMAKALLTLRTVPWHYNQLSNPHTSAKTKRNSRKHFPFCTDFLLQARL